MPETSRRELTAERLLGTIEKITTRIDSCLEWEPGATETIANESAGWAETISHLSEAVAALKGDETPF